MIKKRRKLQNKSKVQVQQLKLSNVELHIILYIFSKFGTARRNLDEIQMNLEEDHG